jgi:hypothetical protein
MTRLPTKKRKKTNKYRAIKSKVNGITFDSIKEGKKYRELLLKQRSGSIRDLQIQVPLTLQGKFKTREGKSIRAIKYIADFVYYDNSLKKIVIFDTKGMETQVFKIKEKMLLMILQDKKYDDYIFMKG